MSSSFSGLASVLSIFFPIYSTYLLEFVISRIILNWDFHNRCSYQFSKWETSSGKFLHQIGGCHETFRFGSSFVYGSMLLNSLHRDSQVVFLIKMLPNMPLCYWFASQLALAYLIHTPWPWIMQLVIGGFNCLRNLPILLC